MSGIPSLAPLLIESADWRLLGLLLERPRAGWHDEVVTLAREIAAADLRAAAGAAREATEGEYLALLGPGGAVSPREVAYRGMEDPARVLADIGAFHAAFAFHPASEDPVDHLAVAAGFAGYLSLKTAYAEFDGRVDAARTAAEARDNFIAAHVSAFATAVAERLAAVLGSDSEHYLLRAARAIVRRVPAPAPATTFAIQPDDAEDDADDLSCGPCP
jgi:hypothetical protein